MIPYVRKSFYKHYINGLKYIENVSHYEEMIGDDIAETSIDEDFYKLYSRAYKYAMDMTTKEVYQAVEGMYHNLKIWA